MKVILKAKALSADIYLKPFPPILYLCPKVSSCLEDDESKGKEYGYSVLVIPPAVKIPYNLCPQKSQDSPLPTPEAKKVVSCS